MEGHGPCREWLSPWRNLSGGVSNSIHRVFKELLNLVSPGAGVPTDERRDTIRLNCSISATMKSKKMTHEVRVVNASLTGLCVELESKVRRKTVVTVSRDQYGGPVTGSVIWCRALKGSNRYQLGIGYADDKEMLKKSWLKPALRDLGFTVGRISEKRQLTRVPGNHLRCFLKSPNGETYSAGELVNLSVGGALAQSDVEIPLDHELLLKVDPVANAPEFVVKSRVTTCKRNSQTRKYEVGLRFLQSEDKLLKCIRKHMSAMMGSR